MPPLHPFRRAAGGRQCPLPDRRLPNLFSRPTDPSACWKPTEFPVVTCGPHHRTKVWSLKLLATCVFPNSKLGFPPDIPHRSDRYFAGQGVPRRAPGGRPRRRTASVSMTHMALSFAGDFAYHFLPCALNKLPLRHPICPRDLITPTRHSDQRPRSWRCSVGVKLEHIPLELELESESESESESDLDLDLSQAISQTHHATLLVLCLEKLRPIGPHGS
ncbi:predicted protein [Postia placenta Mad-698-R]|uniref:Uncharacterized protein n=1 Tax=Postia placenta MAD-698-R-SB12 TaxID=670580 RepID=A0A1X6NCD7_9APHY|nr:hypothetical protein POSPLADRAFT_1064686 [Postia placenta MAD-698-R-SB12]EED84563.1 predicted protein [Postia placenta Mad-698-R]OSX66305.1 hypothetical protein POSPLADRAFT_1064686 [Postia placenta MAD-698-R-SB12]